MFIYIPLEIPTRELHGHLLLSIEAASQGHTILLASSNEINLFRRLGLLKKGTMILKNVNVSSDSISLYNSFLNDGYELCVLDQEPSILWGNFKRFLFDYNITKDQFLPFKSVFCWGKRDTNGFKDLFKNKQTNFINTGSPRLDLWREDFKDLYDHPLGASNEKYILFVSNFGFLMGKRHWTEWIEPGKAHETLQTMQHIENFIDVIEEDQKLLMLFIKSIRYLATQIKTHKIIIRPHPLDSIKKWKNLFKDFENVIISDNISPLSQWINFSDVVIQNSCTSAIESVVNKKPVINLGKKRVKGGLIIPSQMGLEIPSLEGLMDGLSICLDKNQYHKIQIQSELVLEPILNFKSNNAAKNIISTFKKLDQQDYRASYSRIHILSLNLLAFLKNTFDSFRKKVFMSNHKTPSYKLNHAKINKEIAKLAQIKKLPIPSSVRVSKHGLLIKQ